MSASKRLQFPSQPVLKSLASVALVALFFLPSTMSASPNPSRPVSANGREIIHSSILGINPPH
jgi:hypothetical protein